MALECVFGTPPPIVGVANNTLQIHGEKQRTTSMDGSEVEKEEGEIEDGEIVDSQDEEGAPAEEHEANSRPTGTTGFDIMGMLQRDLENGVEESMDGVKKKKKKKKRRKRPFQQELGENGPTDAANDPAALQPSKQKQKKRKRYVDHDRIQEDDNVPWLNQGKSFSRRSESIDARGRLSQSPPLQPPNKQRSPSRSPPPPGLYDSPPESSDEYDGPPNRGGSFGRFSMNSANYEALGERDPTKPAIPLGIDFSQHKGMKGRRGGGVDKRGKGRPKRRRKDQQRPICKFYLDGKCAKGLDCGYSHDTPLIKKQELCKFYLNGFCAKSETCIFMHKEFPCKFFHTGAKCYSADKCKFSHDTLTDEMKFVLQRYLDKEGDPNSGEESPSPMPHRPSLLGSPPRHIKEMAAAASAGQDPHKRIPSLFDIEVKPPPGGNPQQQPQQQPMRPNFYSEAMGSPSRGPVPGTRPPLLPFPPSSFDPDQNDYPFEENDTGAGYGQMGPGCDNGPRFNSPNRMMPFGNQQHQQGPEPYMMDIDERYPPVTEMWDLQDEDDENPNIIGHQEQMDPSKDRQSFHPIPWRNLAIVDVDMRHCPPSASNGEDLPDEHSRGDASNDRDASHDRDMSHSSESDGEANKLSDGSSGGNILIPLHLPKKQRELFLRIQQQQRQAGSSQEDSDKGESKKKEEEQPEAVVENAEEESSFKEDVGKGEDEEELAIKIAEKEPWFSSDDDDEDEDKPLTAVLKKLQQEPIQKEAEAPAPPVFNIAQMLQSIAGIGQAPTEAKPTPVVKPDLSRDPRAHRLAELRDPRSARNTAADPRVRGSRDPRMLANPVIAELPRFVDPRFGPGPTPDSIHSSFQPPSFHNGKEQRRPPLLRTPPGPPLTLPCNDSGDSVNNAHHSIPYRLHAIAVPQPNYSNVLQKTDPRLLQSDPRLKRRLGQDRRPSMESGSDEGKSRRPSMEHGANDSGRRPSIDSAGRPLAERAESESSKGPMLDKNDKHGSRIKPEPTIPTPAELAPHIMASVKSELIVLANIKPEKSKPQPPPVTRPAILRKVKGAKPVSTLSIFDQVLQVTDMPPSPLMQVEEIQECDKRHVLENVKSPDRIEIPGEMQVPGTDKKLMASSPGRPHLRQPSHSNGSYAVPFELDDDSDSGADDLVIIEAKDEPDTKEEESNMSNDLVIVEHKEAPKVDADLAIVVAKEAPQSSDKAIVDTKETLQSSDLAIVETKGAPQSDKSVDLAIFNTKSPPQSGKSVDLAIVETKAAPQSGKSVDLANVKAKVVPLPKKPVKRPAAKSTDDCIVTSVKLVVKKPKLAAKKPKLTSLRSKSSLEQCSPLDFESALDFGKVKPASTASRSPKKATKNTVANGPKSSSEVLKVSPKVPKVSPNAPKSSPKAPKRSPKAPASNHKPAKSNPKPAKGSPQPPKNPPKAEKVSPKHPKSSTKSKATKKSLKAAEVNVRTPKVVEIPPEEPISRPAIPKLLLKKVGKMVIKTTILPPEDRTDTPTSPPRRHNLRSLCTEQTYSIAEENTCLKDIFMTIDPTASPFC